uniref:Putative secreted peptide n=1 Tax=Anopheles braziliensis TaxID=58242 RepID=A0A2M3ZRX8_9DIPT
MYLAVMPRSFSVFFLVSLHLQAWHTVSDVTSLRHPIDLTTLWAETQRDHPRHHHTQRKPSKNRIYSDRSTAQHRRSYVCVCVDRGV